MLLDASAVIFGKRIFGLVVMGGIGLFLSSSSSSPLRVRCWRMVGSGTLSITSTRHRLFKKESLFALGIGQILLSMEVDKVQSSIFRCTPSSPVSASSSGRSDGLSYIAVRFMHLMCSTNGFWSPSCSLIFDSMILSHEVES